MCEMKIREYPYECIMCSKLFFENPMNGKWDGSSWNHYCPECSGLAFGKAMAIIKGKNVICFYYVGHWNYSAESCSSSYSSVFTHMILPLGDKKQ